MPRVAFQRLQTPRLIIRRFEQLDLPAFVAYRNDPEVARYQGWESISVAEAQAFLHEQLGLQPGMPGRWFQFAIALADSGELIGDCGLRVDARDPSVAELGYTLARQFQHQGYASEAVSQVLDYAFLQLDLQRIIATVDAENRPSLALLERLGLRRERQQRSWFKGRWADEFQYLITRQEWLDAPGD